MLIFIGGNGFIGRHVTIAAAKRGLAIAVVARRPDRNFLKTHAPTAVSWTLEEFDTSAGDALISRAEAIVYLVNQSVPASNISNPQGEIGANVVPGFDLFLRVARRNPAAKLVFLSSGGSVYGDASVDLLSEDHPLRPISPYGLGKVLSEQCLQFCGTIADQRYAILRVSNPIGRWQRGERQGLVPAILRCIDGGVPLQIFGDGTYIRDYIDCDDLADAILRVALDRTLPSDVWNIGSGVGHSILEVIDLVEACTASRPALTFVPRRSVDPSRIVLDTHKARRDFGWNPKTDLKNAILALAKERNAEKKKV